MSLYQRVNSAESAVKNSFSDVYQNTRDYLKKYFEVKDEEVEFYKKLGVDKFRKYWINGGSYWANKNKKLSWLNLPKTSKLEKIVELIKITKQVETVHLIGTAVTLPIIIKLLSDHNYVGAASFSALEIIGNLYPIMSQRVIRKHSEELLNRYNNR